MTALDDLLAEYDSLVRSGPRHDDRSKRLMKSARQERAEHLALIHTLALALARQQGIPLDECDGGLLGKAREVLGRYATTNRKD